MGLNANEILESLKKNKYGKIMGPYLMIKEQIRNALEHGSMNLSKPVVSFPMPPPSQHIPLTLLFHQKKGHWSHLWLSTHLALRRASTIALILSGHRWQEMLSFLPLLYIVPGRRRAQIVPVKSIQEMWCCPMCLQQHFGRGTVPATWARHGQENLSLPQRRLYASREWAIESGLAAWVSVASRVLWSQKPSIYLSWKWALWKRQCTEPSERVNKHGRVHHNLDLVHYTILTSAASSRF